MRGLRWRKCLMRPSLRIFFVELARSILQKRGCALFCKVSKAKIVFLAFATVKVSPPSGTTGGARIFWKQVRKRPIGDTTREANPGKCTGLKKENYHLMRIVAEVTLKNRVLEKSLHGTDSADVDLWGIALQKNGNHSDRRGFWAFCPPDSEWTGYPSQYLV